MMSKKRVLGQRQKERGVALNVPDPPPPPLFKKFISTKLFYPIYETWVPIQDIMTDTRS